MRHRPWRSITALALVASLGLAAAGCFNPFRPQVSGQTFVISPAPVPTTARDLIMLFKWCWENRDIARYKTLFTDDYRFAFAITDSAGNGYRSAFDQELARGLQSDAAGRACDQGAFAVKSAHVGSPSGRRGRTIEALVSFV